MLLSKAVALAFLAACGVVCAADTNDALLSQAQTSPKDAFLAYAQKHNRDYLNNQQASWTVRRQAVPDKELEQRYEVFVQNLRRIVEHNARNDVSYTLGLNGFADLTTEEFAERYFGTGPRKDMATLRSMHRGADLGRSSEHFPLSHNTPPARVNWVEAGIITPIKDQHVNGSKCGCCYAFGGVAGIEAANAKFTGQAVSLSEQQIVDCDGLDYGCDGGDFWNVVQYVHENGGIDSDADYPYLAQEDKCRKRKARKHHVVTVDGYQFVPEHNETALMQSVAFLPTIVAVCCGQYIDQWHLYAGGIFDTNAHCTAPLDHAVLVVGYGAEADGTPYWLIKNSWGSHWGEGGFMKLLRNVSDPLGQNGLLSLPPAYVIKEHGNPGPHAFQGRRHGHVGSHVLALPSMLSRWFSMAQEA
ncbi:hypothetical protein N2152v2_005843 [Parachlorella kessleri]